MASQYFGYPEFNGRDVSLLFFIFPTAHSDFRSQFQGNAQPALFL
jgi:hypothetical protein